MFLLIETNIELNEIGIETHNILLTICNIVLFITFEFFKFTFFFLIIKIEASGQQMRTRRKG